MPVTPFHFGPGLLIKSLFPRGFSFWVFVISQIVIDLEPIVRIFSGIRPVHGLFHTFSGSLIAGGITVLLVKPLFAVANALHDRFQVVRREEPAYIAPAYSVICITALIGAGSHVLLDSLMHRDMIPFKPFSLENPFLKQVSFWTLHCGCVLAGILGWIFWYRRRNPRKV